MKVLQYHKTRIAYSPTLLVNSLNKFTDHEVRAATTTKTFRQIVRDWEPDVVHFHNRWLCCQDSEGKIAKFIQYHSPPNECQTTGSYIENGDIHRLVIAQYHATLPVYSDCTVVRNHVDFTEPIYDISEVRGKIRVAFSPTTKISKGFANKGWGPTEDILKRLKAEFPNRFDYGIMCNQPLKDCLEFKRSCNVVIDECATGSYHRSGLEGLAMGKLTICSVSAEVGAVMLKACEASTVPFENVWLKDLHAYLRQLVLDGPDRAIQVGARSRAWMEEFWHPEAIMKEFSNLYTESRV